ncbi:hypothetical protein [Kribbella italica]|uniref:Uncharacterized protein n=1 Tax=Kribbella italica TaxID=1540520 RepID=A0A7W9MRM3_9ACTN|nr:hypothetical protein [Kribbella italica]MBB5833791.1 hypothetical protein [Kribbella italica]
MLVTNVFVTTQGRAVVLTWASVGLDLAYSLLIGSVGQSFRPVVACGHRSRLQRKHGVGFRTVTAAAGICMAEGEKATAQTRLTA